MSKHTRFAKGNMRILVVGLFLIALSGPGSEASGGLTGTIKDASGKPVVGALVRVKTADSRLMFLVISQPKGRYTTPDLPTGKYIVQSFGGGHQSEPSPPVDVNGRQGKIDVVMSTPQKVYPLPKQYTDSDYEALMPEGDGKKLLLAKCEICHSPGHFVSRRKSLSDWKDTVLKMRYRWDENPQLVQKYIAKTGKSVIPVSDREVDVIAECLANNFGADKPPLFPPPHPDQHMPRTLLKGSEAKYFAMELSLGGNQLVGAFDIDTDGTIWVSEKKSGILGRFDPTTLSYSRVYTPPVNVTQNIFATVAVDPGGKIWFTSNVVPNAQWFQYDPMTKVIINTYDVPVPTTPGGDIFFNALRFHSGGSIWATGTAHHRIVKLDPNTRKVTEFRVREGQHPFGITVGGDNNIWYAGDADNLLVKIDPKTDTMTPYPLPVPNTGPRRIAADAEGNLWAASLDRGKLVKMDYRTGSVTEYSPPTAGSLQAVDVDKKRNLIWFSEYAAIKIGRFDPRTNGFLELPLINGDVQPWIVQVDPTNQNRVWWNSRSGRIGYIQLID